jgi:hypothetical protein
MSTNIQSTWDLINNEYQTSLGQIDTDFQAGNSKLTSNGVHVTTLTQAMTQGQENTFNIPNTAILEIYETITLLNAPLIPSNFSTVGTPSWSGDWTTTYPVGNAFDGVDATSVFGRLPSALTFQFNSTQTVSRLAITNQGVAEYDWTPDSPTSFTFSGSNDGINYTNLLTVSGDYGWGGNSYQTRTWNLTTTGSYLYYTVNFTGVYSNGQGVVIRGIQMYSSSLTTKKIASKGSYNQSSLDFSVKQVSNSQMIIRKNSSSASTVSINVIS